MKKKITSLLILLTFVCLLFGAPGDETVVLTDFNDLRSEKLPVWFATVTATWDADDTADVTQTITINGTIEKVMFTTPDATNTVTYQVRILDNEDKEIFDSDERAENAEYAFSTSEPVTGTIDVVIGPSGALGATNPDAVVTLRGR